MSPKNSATTTTSRNEAEANSANTAKFAALPLARSTRFSEPVGGPSSASANAAHRMTGSSANAATQLR